jgi:hypothetical protein
LGHDSGAQPIRFVMSPGPHHRADRADRVILASQGKQKQLVGNDPSADCFAQHARNQARRAEGDRAEVASQHRAVGVIPEFKKALAGEIAAITGRDGGTAKAETESRSIAAVDLYQK